MKILSVFIVLILRVYSVEETIECDVGYALNGGSCEDLNECEDLSASCSSSGICSNTEGSYVCSCNDGFSGDGAICSDIDECTVDSHNCDPYAICGNSDGSFTCSCSSGFEGDGLICDDIDECELNPCDPLANCINSVGAYLCECQTGYSGSGFDCYDTNECSIQTDTCHRHATCTNTVSSFTCTCKDGYSGDGEECSDVNECTDGTHECAESATCRNRDGTYSCSCPVGYTGGFSPCVDVNECASNKHSCGNSTCENTMGSFSCACPLGTQNNGLGCEDVDECGVVWTHTCDEMYGICTNVWGSFTCVCRDGYSGDGTSCTPDPCVEGSGDCGDSLYCVADSEGETLCEETKSPGNVCLGEDVWECDGICNENVCLTNPCKGASSCNKCLQRSTTYATCVWTLSQDTGGYTCTPQLWVQERGLDFEDVVSDSCPTELVDECLFETHTCHDSSTCYDKMEGYTCLCDTGYEMANDNACSDIDECALENTCHYLSKCTNTDGSFSCDCPSGFDGDGLVCDEIDECENAIHNCATSAECINVAGSFKCSCSSGWIGPGTSCVDVNECDTFSECHANSTCVNSAGSFMCVCLDGYQGDGLSCVDVDECDMLPCDGSATCSNSYGSFACSCLEGYEGDGILCTDVMECARSSTLCAGNEACINTVGSFICSCQDGYSYDNATEVCVPENECLRENMCDEHELCYDTLGSFTCFCSDNSTQGSGCQEWTSYSFETVFVEVSASTNVTDATSPVSLSLAVLYQCNGLDGGLGHNVTDHCSSAYSLEWWRLAGRSSDALEDLLLDASLDRSLSVVLEPGILYPGTDYMFGVQVCTKPSDGNPTCVTGTTRLACISCIAASILGSSVDDGVTSLNTDLVVEATVDTTACAIRSYGVSLNWLDENELLPALQSQTGPTLQVPSSSLAYGDTYSLVFTACILDADCVEVRQVVRIQERSMFFGLLGDSREHGSDFVLRLDASRSYPPAGDPFTFTWSCKQGMWGTYGDVDSVVSTSESCYDAKVQTAGSLLTILPSDLTKGLFIFRLKGIAGTVETDSKEVVVEITGAGAPAVRCTYGSWAVSTTDAFYFPCTVFSSSAYTITWESTGSRPLDLSDQFVVGSSTDVARLKLLAGAMSPGTTYTFRMWVENSVGNAFIDVSVVANSPPVSLAETPFLVSPSQGNAVTTLFTLSVSEDWSDDNADETDLLMFQFAVVVGGRELILSRFQYASELVTPLPGPESGGNTEDLVVRVYVRDRVGDVVVVDSSVTVTWAVEAQADVYDFARDVIDLVVNPAVFSHDLDTALNFAACATIALNHFSRRSESADEEREIRSDLLWAVTRAFRAIPSSQRTANDGRRLIGYLGGALHTSPTLMDAGLKHCYILIDSALSLYESAEAAPALLRGDHLNDVLKVVSSLSMMDGVEEEDLKALVKRVGLAALKGASFGERACGTSDFVTLYVWRVSVSDPTLYDLHTCSCENPLTVEVPPANTDALQFLFPTDLLDWVDADISQGIDVMVLTFPTDSVAAQAFPGTSLISSMYAVLLYSVADGSLVQPVVDTYQNENPWADTIVGTMEPIKFFVSASGLDDLGERMAVGWRSGNSEEVYVDGDVNGVSGEDPLAWDMDHCAVLPNPYHFEVPVGWEAEDSFSWSFGELSSGYRSCQLTAVPDESTVTRSIWDVDNNRELGQRCALLDWTTGCMWDNEAQAFSGADCVSSQRVELRCVALGELALFQDSVETIVYERKEPVPISENQTDLFVFMYMGVGGFVVMAFTVFCFVVYSYVEKRRMLRRLMKPSCGFQERHGGYLWTWTLTCAYDEAGRLYGRLLHFAATIGIPLPRLLFAIPGIRPVPCGHYEEETMDHVIVGTALAFAHISLCSLVDTATLRKKMKHTSEYFAGSGDVYYLSTPEDFLELVEKMKIMLWGNLSRKGWRERARVWKVVLLMKPDMTWDPTAELAAAVAPSVEYLLQGGGVDDDAMCSLLNKSIPQVLQDSVSTIKVGCSISTLWATALAIQFLQQSKEEFLITPWPQQRSIQAEARQALSLRLKDFYELHLALLSAAELTVLQWNRNLREALSARVRAEEASTSLAVRGGRQVLSVLQRSSVWTAFSKPVGDTMPTPALTMVIFVSLTYVTMLVLLIRTYRILACCEDYKEYLCNDMDLRTPCLTCRPSDYYGEYDTCPDMEVDDYTCGDLFYTYGDYTEGFECDAFPTMSLRDRLVTGALAIVVAYPLKKWLEWFLQYACWGAVVAHDRWFVKSWRFVMRKILSGVGVRRLLFKLLTRGARVLPVDLYRSRVLSDDGYSDTVGSNPTLVVRAQPGIHSARTPTPTPSTASAGSRFGKGSKVAFGGGSIPQQVQEQTVPSLTPKQVKRPKQDERPQKPRKTGMVRRERRLSGIAETDADVDSSREECGRKSTFGRTLPALSPSLHGPSAIFSATKRALLQKAMRTKAAPSQHLSPSPSEMQSPSCMHTKRSHLASSPATAVSPLGMRSAIKLPPIAAGTRGRATLLRQYRGTMARNQASERAVDDKKTSCHPC
eukprot:Rmarinus@m.25544